MRREALRSALPEPPATGPYRGRNIDRRRRKKDIRVSFAPTPAEQYLNMARVLVIDDDGQELNHVVMKLQAAGHNVTAAPDGGTGLDALARGDFDAVLTDIAMPEVDGIGVLKGVRRLNVPVATILMTADPDVETVIKAVEHGAFRYI
jgi:PleD family two-component response regulator